ncbi:homeobox protein vent1-like [Lineus longissimus]|uniref:homeobox protein vent1-like n=1 Tax=Lineus longissimus TaxID=88925 RepID=UPI00315D4010
MSLATINDLVFTSYKEGSFLEAVEALVTIEVDSLFRFKKKSFSRSLRNLEEMMLEQQQLQYLHLQSYQPGYPQPYSMAYEHQSPLCQMPAVPRDTPKRKRVNFHSIADLVKPDENDYLETARKIPSPNAMTSFTQFQSIAADLTSLMTTPSPCKSTTSSVDSGRGSPAATTASYPSPCSSPSSDSARGTPSPTNTGPKKSRTIFKPHQVAVLEQVFSRCQYPEPDMVERLASDLDTKEAKVKVWFQNKRARWRKRPVDSTHVTSQEQSPWLPGVMSPLPYQHNMGGQHGYRVGSSPVPVHPMYQQYVPMMPYQQQMTSHVGQQATPVYYGPHAQMLQNASKSHFVNMTSPPRTANQNGLHQTGQQHV